MTFQWPGGVAVPGPSAQNSAICVWSAVRDALSIAPSALTSSYAVVYAWSFNGGGPAGRNCAPLDMQNGRSAGHWGSSAGKFPGGVGCQSPGSAPGTKATI